MEKLKYYLIGKKLSHSYSEKIHNMLGNSHYHLLEIDEDSLKSFMLKKDFDGLNITVPYKEQVIEFLDVIDETALKIGAVNTVVNKNNCLIGYNTDFYGFTYLLKVNNISLEGKNILILGNGGTSKTVKAVCENEKAKEINIVSRSNSEGTISYEDALKKVDTEVIINTTPVGMYPNINHSPIQINSFTKLYAVLDVIYNPLDTRFIKQAKELDIKTSNGLIMLVAQAKKAAEYFTDTKIEDNKIKEIYQTLLLEKLE